MKALDSLCEMFLSHLAIEKNYSNHTIVAYTRDLKKYRQWCKHNSLQDIHSITKADIEEFAKDIQEGFLHFSALGVASANRCISVVKSFHQYASQQDETIPELSVSMIQDTKKLPKVLSIETIIDILNSIDMKRPIGLRNRAIVEMLYGTGMRVSELVALNMSDIDAEERIVMIRMGKGSKQRIVPIGKHGLDALDAYVVRARQGWATRPTNATFLNTKGDRLKRQSVWRILAKIGEEYSRFSGKEIELGPHVLRHSCATHLLQGGSDVRVVQEILGHVSVATTQIYTYINIEHLQTSYVMAHPRAKHKKN